MSVKELIVDSWQNMLKNNFIVKCILVSLAYFVVYIAALVVVSVAGLIHWVLALIAVIAVIIVFVPITISTSKVLLDVFQGRDAKVFGFLSYGFNNIKRIWAITGRIILKILPLFILQILLIVVLIVYMCSTIVSTYQKYSSVTRGVESPLAGGYLIDSFDSLEDSMDSLDSSFDFDLDSYDYDYDTSDLENELKSLSKDIASDSLSNEIVKDAASLVLKSVVFFVLYFIAAVVIDVLMIMKSLYYKFSYLIAFEDDSATALQAVEKSESLMRGNRAKYFWTLVLVIFLVEVVIGILTQIESVLVALGALVIAFLLLFYVQSYEFTFYKKLVGDDTTPAEPVTEPAPSPVVEEAKPVEPAPVVEEVKAPVEDDNPLSKEASTLDESLAGSDDEDLSDKE